MARRFAGTTASISVTTTADLGGFGFTFGTIAALINFQSVAAANSGIFITNLAVSPAVDFYVAGTSNFLGWYDGTNFRESTIAVVTNETLIVAATKATGTTTVRMHMYRPGTNAWSHGNTGGTSVNGGATTQFMIGDSSGTIPLSAEIWQIAAWQGRAMTDSEVERLGMESSLDWALTEPGFYERWSDGREVGDMTSTMGRLKVRQTSRIATVRGSIKPPGGFGTLASTRRR